MAKFPGLIVGFVLGYLLDAKARQSGLYDLGNFFGSDDKFFVSCFSMFAKLAKADGVVVQSEIVAVEHIMKNVLSLEKSSRKKAIGIFKKAKDDNSTFLYHAVNFNRQYFGRTAILNAMLETLFTIATADGELNQKEESLILSASQTFGFSDSVFLEMKDRYHGVNSLSAQMGDKSPFEILESSPEDSLELIKKRYRKLIQQYHPDKIAGKDLPEGFDRYAAEQFQKIQAAFSEVKRLKGKTP